MLSSAESCPSGSVESEKNYESAEDFNNGNKLTLQHGEQSHSVDASKFSLASLLTSSSSGISCTTVPVSSLSEMTSTSLPDTNRSLHHQQGLQDNQSSQSPLHDMLLPNHRKTVSPSFSEQNTSVQTDKPVHSDNSSNEHIVKGSTKFSGASKESRTNSFGSSDDTSSNIHDDNHESTSNEKLPCSSPNQNSEVGEVQPTSVHDTAHTPFVDHPLVPTTRTKTGGLMDLLTTAVEDKDSPLLLDPSEDKWMAPPSLKEVRVLLFQFLCTSVQYAFMVRFLF